MTQREKHDLIKHQLAELGKIYPEPTEEQFEAAKRALAAGDMKFSDETIRRALKCSINRDTKKFHIERFWQVLPEFAEMELK